MNLNHLLQFTFSGLTTGAAYSLVALGFGIVYMGTGAVNFVQGEYVMLGGIIAGTLHELYHPPLVVTIVITLGCGVLAGLLTEVLGVRWMSSPTADGITIATIGLAMALKAGAMIVSGRRTVSLPSFSGTNPLHLGQAALLPQTVWNLGIVVFAAVLLTLFFRYTRQGVMMRASADDRETSSLMGVGLKSTTAWCFTLAAVLGATAGCSLTPITLMSFDAGTLLGLKGFAAAMLGGLGNMYGAVAGGLVLGLAEAFTAGYGSSAYADVIAFVILLLLLFTRPTGLFGRASVRRV